MTPLESVFATIGIIAVLLGIMISITLFLEWCFKKLKANKKEKVRDLKGRIKELEGEKANLVWRLSNLQSHKVDEILYVKSDDFDEIRSQLNTILSYLPVGSGSATPSELRQRLTEKYGKPVEDGKENLLAKGSHLFTPHQSDPRTQNQIVEDTKQLAVNDALRKLAEVE